MINYLPLKKESTESLKHLLNKWNSLLQKTYENLDLDYVQTISLLPEL